jgi:hypothetical protein
MANAQIRFRGDRNFPARAALENLSRRHLLQRKCNVGPTEYTLRT